MSEPGWYRDPGNADIERYWDGQQWTQHARQRHRSPWRSLWGFGAVAVLVLASVGGGVWAVTRGSGPTACSDIEQWRTNFSDMSLIDDAISRAKDVTLHVDLLTLRDDLRKHGTTTYGLGFATIDLNKIEIDCQQGLS